MLSAARSLSSVIPEIVAPCHEKNATRLHCEAFAPRKASRAVLLCFCRSSSRLLLSSKERRYGYRGDTRLPPRLWRLGSAATRNRESRQGLWVPAASLGWSLFGAARPARDAAHSSRRT